MRGRFAKGLERDGGLCVITIVVTLELLLAIEGRIARGKLHTGGRNFF